MLDDYPGLRDIIEKLIFVDCCIVTPVRPLIIAEMDMGEGYDPWSVLPPVRIILHNMDRDSWGLQKFGKNTFKYPKACHTQTEGEMLVVDYNGEVWYHGLGKDKQFEDQGIGQRGINALKNIHGTIYATGDDRAVFRRDGQDQWTHLSEQLESQTEALNKQLWKKGGELWTGFDCIDGFEANKDLYAAGGNGDVWRYDGEDWLPVDIPLPKMQINTICCAEDGYVYIAGRFGTILKGREDSWQIIQHTAKTEFSDVACYKGRVYLASAARLYYIDGAQTEIVKYNARDIPANHGHLYVNHGLMMTAGRSSAAIFDGENWKVLYGGGYLDEETSRRVMQEVMRAAIREETGDND